MGAEVFHALKSTLSDAGHSTNVGDEGGFAPALTSEALDFIMQSIERAGYKIGDDVCLALDYAATEFFIDSAYKLEGEGKTLDADGMSSYLKNWWKPIRLYRSRMGWRRTIGTVGVS